LKLKSSRCPETPTPTRTPTSTSATAPAPDPHSKGVRGGACHKGVSVRRQCQVKSQTQCKHKERHNTYISPYPKHTFIFTAIRMKSKIAPLWNVYEMLVQQLLLLLVLLFLLLLLLLLLCCRTYNKNPKQNGKENRDGPRAQCLRRRRLRQSQQVEQPRPYLKIIKQH